MTIRLAVLLVFLLAVSECASAQQPDTSLFTRPLGVIDTVIISGNHKTRDYVILNEMTLRQGGSATYEGMNFDRNRIYSLGLFTRVDIFYDSLQTIHFLMVDVSERWYLIPFPIFGFRDGDPKRPYYGFGLLHNNVSGRNQKLYASVALGYDPSANLSFVDPLFDNAHNLSLGGGFSFSRVRNRSEIESSLTGDFDDLQYNINGSLGKRLTLYQFLGLNAGYQIVSVSQYRAGRTVSTSGTDRFLYATASYLYDSRDLAEYASQGRYLSLYVTKYGMGESSVNFTRVGVDARQFVPLPLNVTLAVRAGTSLVAGGRVPTYSHMFFGYGERIRGWFKTVFEGEDLLGTTIELRHMIFGPTVYQLRSLPLPPEFTVWRLGVSLALFADAGTTWYRGDRLTLSSFASGYGAGLDFLLPYSYVARIEYAWNDYGRGQFILDLRGSI